MSATNVPSIVDPFDGFQLPPGMSPDLARWTMLNKRTAPIFPEYSQIARPEVLAAEQEISQNYTYVSRRLHFLSAELDISDVNLNTKADARAFFSVMTTRADEFEYIDRRTRGAETWDQERIPLKFSYAGFHWRMPVSLLVALSNSTILLSPEFRTVGQEICQVQLSMSEIKKYSRVMPPDVFIKSFKVLITAMLKNPRSLYHRVLMTHRFSLFEKWGYSDLFELEYFAGILYPVEMKSEMNNLIRDILGEIFIKIDLEVKTKEIRAAADILAGKAVPLNKKVPWWDDITTLRPNTDLPLLGADEIDLNQERGSEIVIYKVVRDEESDDKSRLEPNSIPYSSGVTYDPPITRGVTYEQQPFKVVVANSEVKVEETFGDTPAMRKTMTCDMITRALDWAARMNLPLPPEGTELFAHFADSTDTGKIIEIQLPLAVYCRRRRYKFLVPFPEYSYGVFTIKSRFSILDSPVMTWDAIKDYIITSPEHDVPLEQRDPTVFFKGAAFSHTFIREHMQKLSGKPIFGFDKNVKTGGNKSKIIIPAGKFLIDLPDSRGQVFTQPMTVPQMSKYRYLLDLPGYGMWSTRLKFIILTKSVVIRVLFIDVTYDPVSKQWSKPDPGDIYETYFDCIAPFDIVPTIIGETYLASKYISTEITDKLNRESRNRIVANVGKIYESYNMNMKKTKAVVERASGIIESLTNDKISEYIYKIVMKMGKMYGHIRMGDAGYTETISDDIRVRCPN